MKSFNVFSEQQMPYPEHHCDFPEKKNEPNHEDPRRGQHVPNVQHVQHDGEFPNDDPNGGPNDDRHDDRNDVVQCVRYDGAQCVQHDGVLHVQYAHDGDSGQLRS